MPQTFRFDDVPALDQHARSALDQARLRPELNRSHSSGIQIGTTLPLLGTAFDQGVYQDRVDQINKFYNPSARDDFEGAGMTIGFISDTIVTTEVNNFDFPGAGGNPTSTQPVVILQGLRVGLGVDLGARTGKLYG